MALQKDLREFLNSLNSRGAEYLIVGAYAVAYYGFPRLTGDLDLLVNRAECNAECVAAAIEEFSAGSIRFDPRKLCEPDRMLRIGMEPNRVDILTSISGVEFAEAWPDREGAVLDGVPVAYISRRHLLQNKMSTGRSKDLADVEELTKE
jgi:hypothetical protein